ncbi:GDP-mannose 4,6-dehydratase [soil metagenome]
MTIGKEAGDGKTVYVMGINGFVGHHLAHALHESGAKVMGVGVTENIADRLRDIADGYYQCDLSDAEAVNRLDLSTADAVINLAGLANVGASFDNPDEYFRVNRLVHTNVCDAIKEQNLTDIRLVAISTGAVYDSSSPMPLDERSLTVTKGSPYALSKLAMETALKPYQDEGMDIIVARPFNHTGPGQGPGFLVPDLLLQLRSLEDGDKTILVGNLKSKRDYTDVRDIARAYCTLALAPAGTLSSQLYNICSGQSTSGETILHMLLDDLNLSGKVEVRIDQARIRPDDPADIYGSYGLLNKDAGWSPQIELGQTLADFAAST